MLLVLLYEDLPCQNETGLKRPLKKKSATKTKRVAIKCNEKTWCYKKRNRILFDQGHVPREASIAWVAEKENHNSTKSRYAL